MKSIPLNKIKNNLEVKFNGPCLEVPEVSSGLTTRAVNDEALAAYGQLLRTAQNSLDRMPTHHEDISRGFFKQALVESTSPEERAVFEELRRLNAEVVLRVLVMRRLATAAQIGR